MPSQFTQFNAEFFKALAHPLRIAILDSLRDGERTVAEISQKFGIEQTNASQQLAVLRNKNIIAARKAGTNVYYSVSDATVYKLLDAAREIFNNHLIGVRIMLEEIRAVCIASRGLSTSRRLPPCYRSGDSEYGGSVETNL